MKKFNHYNRVLALCAVSLSSMSVSAPSAALDHGALEVGPIGTTPLKRRVEIPSDGDQYLPAVAPVTLNSQVRVVLDPGRIGRVKSWEVWFKTKIDDGEFGSPYEHTYAPSAGESYPFGSRPKTVDTMRHLVLNFDRGRDYCNDNADLLRSQGFSDAEIFAADRTLPLAVDIGLQYEFSGPNGIQIFDQPNDWAVNGEKVREPIDLVCQAYNPYPEGGLQGGGNLGTKLKAEITYANLALIHDAEPTDCPALVSAQVLFAAKSQGKFTFRFQNAWQQVSQPIEMEMTAADFKGGHYTKVYERQFYVGTEQEQAGGVFGEDAAVDGGKLNPPADGSAGSGFNEGIDNLYDEQGDGNVHNDSLWVEVLSAAPNSVETSDMEAYSITCNVGGASLDVPVNDKTYSLPGLDGK